MHVQQIFASKGIYDPDRFHYNMNLCEKARQAAICGRLSTAMLPFFSLLASPSPNARYKPSDIMDVTIMQCQGRKPVATTIRSMRRRTNRPVMTGQRYLQLLGGKNPGDMLEICQDMIDKSCQTVVETGQLRGKVKLAVDEHLIPWHTEKNEYSKGGKRKKGTNVFEGYISSQVVAKKINPTVACYPIATGEPQTHYLGGLIENAQRNGVDIEMIFLDRGFASVDNIREMERQNVKFIMPLPGNDKLYEMMQEYHDGKAEPVREYTMTNKYGRSATATLVIVHKKNPGKSGEMSDLYVGFVTNIKVGDPKELIRLIPKEYRLRWGIETGYRKLEEARARTNSPRYSARLLLLFFTIVLLNFWLLYQDMYADIVAKEDLVLFDFVDGLSLYIYETDRPP